MNEQLQRAAVIAETGACLEQLRHIVAGIEGAWSDPAIVALTREADRLRSRIALFANTEQERRLRRSLTPSDEESPTWTPAPVRFAPFAS